MDSPHATSKRIERLAQLVGRTMTSDSTMTSKRSIAAACGLCAIASPKRGGDPVIDDSAFLVTVVDRALILVRPAFQDVIVAPTTHVGRLSELSIDEQGQMLAALRQVAVVLGVDEGQGDLTAIDLPGSAEHLCVRAAPRSGWVGDLNPGSSLTDQLREALHANR